MHPRDQRAKTRAPKASRMFAVSTYIIGEREPNYAERTLLVTQSEADFKIQATILARQLLGLEEGPTPPLRRRQPVGPDKQPFYYGDYEIRTDSAVVWFAEVHLPAAD